MKTEYERDYAIAEERHPWFVARRELFAALARGLERSAVLDFGCGTGMFLAHLKARGFGDLTGVEPSAALRERFRDPSIPVHEALPDRRFDAVFALDVLEHIDDDVAALRELRARLAPGGRLFVSVPAHPFLWSRHDEDNLHRRRYRRRELRERLEASGFGVQRLTWWNMVGLGPIALRRQLGAGRGTDELAAAAVGPGAAAPLSPALRCALAILRLENAWVRRWPLPLGVSLVAVATAR